MRRTEWTAVILVLPFAAAGLAQTTASRCADCHFAASAAPRVDHLMEWDQSAHGREKVGCEACHGGDPTTFEILQAHRGMLSSGNPASPVYRARLPNTCGKCHPGPFAAFQQSEHFRLLQSGAGDGPTCSTCHGEVAAHLLSPRGLGKRCARCHGQGKAAAKAEYPGQATTTLQGILEVRRLLQSVASLARRIEDPVRREALMESYRQAEVPLIEAVSEAHSFSFELSQERLELARRRVDALLVSLANQNAMKPRAREGPDPRGNAPAGGR